MGCGASAKKYDAGEVQPGVLLEPTLAVKKGAEESAVESGKEWEAADPTRLQADGVSARLGQLLGGAALPDLLELQTEQPP